MRIYFRTPYEPPRDFTALPSGPLPDSHPFSARNLQGKELWFFTAPIHAPVSKLRDISVQDILDGAPILETTSGRRYCLKADDDAGEEGLAVMAPGSDGLYRAGTRADPLGKCGADQHAKLQSR